MQAASLRQFERQKQVGELAVIDANRAAAGGLRKAANMIVRYQAASVEVARQGVDEMAADAPPVAHLNPVAFLTPAVDVARMLTAVNSPASFGRLVTTFVHDAGRTATSVDYATRDQVVGYIRVVGGSGCARCAILAGRFYRWAESFQRHPNCQCTMEPVTRTYQPRVPDPMTLFSEGRITDLTRAETQAINDGADISKVVNVRRQQAGLRDGSSVIERAGRPTPAGIYRIASDRAEALRLLKRYGYIT